MRVGNCDAFARGRPDGCLCERSFPGASRLIVAAGLTPAYQQILVFDRLRPGEVNRAREVHKCASGKVLNVGLALHHLGGPCLTLALVGGLEGESMERELTALGVPHELIRASKATRTCTTLIDRASGLTTELVENAAPVEPAQLDQFAAAFAKAAQQAQFTILSGSLPAGTPKTFCRELMSLTGARVILDASGEELRAALPLRPFCVKPNREELGRSLGRDLKTEDDLRRAMAEVRTLGAEWVVVSEGSKALRACGEGRTYVFHPAEIRAVNPIGSGDCLAAGIAWALRDGVGMPEAIRFGMAAAADNAAAMLPGRLDLARVRALVPKVTFSEQ